MGAVAGPSLVPRIGARGQRFLQALQNETNHCQDFPDQLWELGMSWMGSMPKSTCVWALSSFADRSCPLMGCRPRFSSFASITPRTS
jgi:hypothetical protein